MLINFSRLLHFPFMIQIMILICDHFLLSSLEHNLKWVQIGEFVNIISNRRFSPALNYGILRVVSSLFRYSIYNMRDHPQNHSFSQAKFFQSLSARYILVYKILSIILVLFTGDFNRTVAEISKHGSVRKQKHLKHRVDEATFFHHPMLT